jgi:hypothetical protein
MLSSASVAVMTSPTPSSATVSAWRSTCGASLRPRTEEVGSPSPKPLQYVPVSTTARPVTHTAEVDVNSAVTSPVAVPSSAATGSASSTVPSTITAAKAITTVRAGCAVNSE